jgi:hypothetical protein
MGDQINRIAETETTTTAPPPPLNPEAIDYKEKYYSRLEGELTEFKTSLGSLKTKIEDTKYIKKLPFNISIISSLIACLGLLGAAYCNLDKKIDTLNKSNADLLLEVTKNLGKTSNKKPTK